MIPPTKPKRQRAAGPTLLDCLKTLYSAGTTGELRAYVKDPLIGRFRVPTNLDAYAGQVEASHAQHDAYLTVSILDGESIRIRGRSTPPSELELFRSLSTVTRY